MKVKLDENLPESLVSALSVLGHDVDTVRFEGLAGLSDPKIWRACQCDERFLITQDLDFSDVRQFKPGTHHGLMLVRRISRGGRGVWEPRIEQRARMGTRLTYCPLPLGYPVVRGSTEPFP
ncbi:MAG: DUF5615 family PIN-like protein [Verrucomicrobia bacterium]|nr:DUF5615 family PIN-like protein [Verrucomicrobiota bacterium]